MNLVFSNNLELERFGITATPKPVEKPKTKYITKPCDKEHATDARDQMMFNAGRYAAGARDSVALRCHEALLEVLDGEA